MVRTTLGTTDEARRFKLDEWMGAMADPDEMKSTVLKLEGKLTKAEIFSKQLETPNELKTAVACDCLQQMGKLLPQYENVMAPIRQILIEALFEKSDDVKQALSEQAFAREAHPDQEDDGEDCFYGQAPFFERVRELEEQLEEAQTNLDELTGHHHVALKHVKSVKAQKNWKNVKSIAKGQPFALTGKKPDSIENVITAYSKLKEDDDRIATLTKLLTQKSNSDMLVRRILPDVMQQLAHRPRDNNFTLLMAMTQDLLPSNGAEMIPRLLRRKAKLPIKDPNGQGLLKHWLSNTASPGEQTEMIHCLCAPEATGHYAMHVKDGVGAVASQFHGRVYAMTVGDHHEEERHQVRCCVYIRCTLYTTHSLHSLHSLYTSCIESS
jgi:hypothetical protein